MIQDLGQTLLYQFSVDEQPIVQKDIGQNPVISIPSFRTIHQPDFFIQNQLTIQLIRFLGQKFRWPLFSFFPGYQFLSIEPVVRRR